MPRIFAYVAHQAGVPDEAAAELLAASRKLDPASQCIAVVTGHGPDLDRAADALRPLYPEIWKLGAESLAYPNAEIVRLALAAVIPPAAIVLVAHGHFGVDLSPGLSIKLRAPYIPDAIGLDPLDRNTLRAVRQEFGGVVNTHVACDVAAGAVVNIRPGAFRPGDSPEAGGEVIDKSADLPPLAARRRVLQVISAETGDVDITKSPVLVSIGRGIGDPENVAIAEDLARALGGAVSCSRPVVDAKWLDKSRQVGSSGKTVRPRVYLACGISGSFQHLAGLKGNPFLVAVNKNPKAPIFRAANIGIVDDLLDFLPALAERVRKATVVTVREARA